jgi:FG-GAP-like repeat
VRAIFLFAVLLPGALFPQDARFLEHTIVKDLKGGYQVVAFDVNHDGKMDLIALASGMSELVWFENPTWERHVIAGGQSRMINLAIRSDGQGRNEIVLASGFENEASKSIGLMSVLRSNEDPRQSWSVKEIDRLTTSHRLRWADISGDGKKVLVNAPLTGAKAAAPDYRDHVPLVFYRPGEWKRETIDAKNEGVQHGIFIVDWDGNGRDAILTASFSGIHLFCYQPDHTWLRTEISKENTSDVAVGHLGKERFLAAIEPWHGNRVAVYRAHADTAWVRSVIDDSLTDGHTILAADLDGSGQDQIVAGFRGGAKSVFIYKAAPDGRWVKRILDNGGMPAASCAAVDLNADGRLDIACIGSTVLKWYENRN